MVTAPCTLLITGLAAYFVLESIYEMRQWQRFFIDIFKWRWEWPVTKADAIYQKGYLKRLPKYRVFAAPTGAEVQLRPGGGTT